jgi:spermidine/putrescine-binding protein
VLWTAALAAGRRDIFSLQGQTLGEAGRWAARLCESGAVLWSDEAGMLADMASGRVVLNVTWPNAVANVNRWSGRRSGTWASVCPDEGVTAFIDNLCVAAACRDPAAADAYIDLAIEPPVQLGLAKSLDFSPVSAAAADLLTPERRAQLHLDDPNFLNRVFLWRPIPNRSEYERIWKDARAGRLIQ